MAKSASENSAIKQGLRGKYYFTAVFLAIQAVLLLGLAVFFHNFISPTAFGLLIFWVAASLGLALLQLRLRSTPAHAAAQPLAKPGDACIFGLPGQTLDLASLCDLMQEGVALVHNGLIIYINKALSYILATYEEKILGTSIDAYVHPEDSRLLTLDGSLETAGRASRATIRLITRPGDTRWVICSTHQLEWREQKVTLLLFENIGPLKQALQNQAEQEQRSRILLERTPLGIAMFDAIGQLKLANTAWHSIWNSIADTASWRSFNILQDSFLPNTPVAAAIRQAFDKKDAGVRNFEHIASWGETLWLNLNFYPMSDPMGQLIGVAMIQQDITAQVRSLRRENDLNAQLSSLRHEVSYAQTLMAQLYDQLGHVLIHFERDGSVSAWNNCAEQRFGLPRNLAIGRNYKQLEANFSPYVPTLQKILTDGEAQNISYLTRQDKDGPHHEEISTRLLSKGPSSIISFEIKELNAHVSARP